MFYDEPTAAGLDQELEGNPYIEELTKIVRYMPKHSILSCATLKSIDAYPELIAAFRSKYPRAICNTVNHSKIPIGACIRGFDGNVYLPHSSCTTPEQLASVIEKLDAEQILQKFYTPEMFAVCLLVSAPLWAFLPSSVSVPSLLLGTILRIISSNSPSAILNLFVMHLNTSPISVVPTLLV